MPEPEEAHRVTVELVAAAAEVRAAADTSTRAVALAAVPADLVPAADLLDNYCHGVADALHAVATAAVLAAEDPATAVFYPDGLQVY